MIVVTASLSIAGLFAIAVFVFAAASCAETIAWWTERGRNRAAPSSPIVIPQPNSDTAVADQYIIYLSGVGRNSGEEVPAKEAQFLDLVESGVPGSVIVRDIFPYSPSSTPLTEHRAAKGIWTGIPKLARRNRRFMILYHIIYFRNLLQVCVSRDRDYGPPFAYGLAKEMIRGLLRYGYRPECPRPVTILCISGGGQLSQAAAPYLKEWLGFKVRVVSVGSVLADDPGTEDLEEIVHLSGSKDVTQYVGRVLGYTGWPVFPNSAWNRFVAAGRFRSIPLGPMKHMGLGDYFSRTARLPDGTTHVHKTAQVVIGLIASPADRTGGAQRLASPAAALGSIRDLPATIAPSVSAGGRA